MRKTKRVEYRSELFPSGGLMMGAGLLFFALVALSFLPADFAESLGRVDSEYLYCQAIVDGFPNSCSVLTSGVNVFPSAVGTSRKIRIRRCDVSSPLRAYNLFCDARCQIHVSPIEIDDAGDMIETVTTETTLLDPERFDSVTAFDIWCDNLFFVNDRDIYVQNLDVSSNKITRRLYTAPNVIEHMEVSGGAFGHYIYYSMNTEGLYRVNFDGNNPELVVSYQDEFTITDLDYSQASNKFVIAAVENLNDHFLYVYDVTSFSGVPIDLDTTTTVPAVLTNDFIRAAAIGTLPSNDQYILSSFDSDGASYTGDTFVEVRRGITFHDMALCASTDECMMGCPGDCACDSSEQFRTCCNALCVERDTTPANENDFSCFCRCEDIYADGRCSAENALDPYPADCPDDLTAAIVCPASSREQAFSVYALTQICPTRICSVDEKGNPAPLPDMAKPLFVRAPCSGYEFPPSIKPPERYGCYVASYDAGDDRTVSLEFIAQEGNNARYPKYSTVSAEVGTCAEIRVWVPRQCNVKLIRWQIGKKRLDRYKGKPVLTFKNVQQSDEGVYEIYFRNARKSYRISFVRLIVYPTPSSTCDNGGLRSLNNGYCICPPGLVGPMCEYECPVGLLGSLGVCSYSCPERFGIPDCGGILFCLENPFGCACYTGFKHPGCTPCPSGWYGRNCEQECTCGPSDCNPITGCP